MSGGVVGSLAFYEAMQAAVDFTNTDRQAVAQAALHTQHACLDVGTSLQHEAAYVAALESEEGRLAQAGLASWYPTLAAANVPVILTLWDGKQWLGPTPYWNWLRLNRALFLNPSFNDPGIFAFDRTSGTMAKIDFCPGKGAWQAPAPIKTPKAQSGQPALTTVAGKEASGEASSNKYLSGLGWLFKWFLKKNPISLPYQKGPVQDLSVVLASHIDPDKSYTPYGVPWSGDAAVMCDPSHFLGVKAVEGVCLQPSVFLDRLGDSKAWGLGNCTLGEFVADGLRCRQPITLCNEADLLAPLMGKPPPPALPLQASGGNTSLFQCLAASYRPISDAVLTL